MYANCRIRMTSIRTLKPCAACQTFNNFSGFFWFFCSQIWSNATKALYGSHCRIYHWPNRPNSLREINCVINYSVNYFIIFLSRCLHIQFAIQLLLFSFLLIFLSVWHMHWIGRYLRNYCGLWLCWFTAIFDLFFCYLHGHL